MVRAADGAAVSKADVALEASPRASRRCGSLGPLFLILSGHRVPYHPAPDSAARTRTGLGTQDAVTGLEALGVVDLLAFEQGATGAFAAWYRHTAALNRSDLSAASS